MAKKKTPKGTKVVRDVEISLDDKTRAKLAEELGEKLKAQTKLELEFSDVKTKWKERLTPVSDRVKAIENFLENGTETKTVETTMVKNYNDNVVEYWFDGAVVYHRPMTSVDRQEDLPIKTRRGRTKENSVVMPPTESEDIGNVRKLETSKRTKRSAVDGPTKGNGLDEATTGSLP